MRRIPRIMGPATAPPWGDISAYARRSSDQEGHAISTLDLHLRCCRCLTAIKIFPNLCVGPPLGAAITASFAPHFGPRSGQPTGERAPTPPQPRILQACQRPELSESSSTAGPIRSAIRTISPKRVTMLSRDAFASKSWPPHKATIAITPGGFHSCTPLPRSYSGQPRMGLQETRLGRADSPCPSRSGRRDAAAKVLEGARNGALVS